MSSYAYVAVDPRGIEMRGTLDVPDQSEALKRIKEMGLFPTKLLENRPRANSTLRLQQRNRSRRGDITINIPGLSGRAKPVVLTAFTRQLATLVEAGMPLLRGLRLLEEQEGNRVMRRVVGELSQSIESGSSFTEAVSKHPKVFNPLYVNMIRAGEIGGALETTLNRLAEFREKAQKIKGKVKSAMFYPCAVLTVAVAIVGILMVFVVPKFKEVFDGLMNGRPLPAFTRFVFGLSEICRHHVVSLVIGVGVFLVSPVVLAQTRKGRIVFDRFKLGMPILGTVFRKAAISRFARTLGTLIGSGVPILQALNIVKETAGNSVVGSVVSKLHENVKEGEALAPTLKSSGVFPVMVAGMVDVGEQTGALPEMLDKVADNYDDEVDNATNAITSLLEPIMIVFLAVVVGSIVIAVFLPIITVGTEGFDSQNGDARAD